MADRYTMKSYAKVVQIGYETSASVEFRDTGEADAALIYCNYFSVDCRSGSSDSADDGYFIVQPSGVYASSVEDITNVGLGAAASSSGGLTGANTASAAGHHEGAGIGGVIGTADGKVEMSLRHQDRTQGVMIFNKLVGTADGPGVTLSPAVFVVTYGNTKQANAKRDHDEDFYPAGN